MLVATGLREPFKESDEDDDLPLSSFREGIPLLWRGTSSVWEWGSIETDWPWEVNAVRLNYVSNESSHGNTGVLDLSLTKESNGGILGLSEDGGGGKIKRIVELFIYC